MLGTRYGSYFERLGPLYFLRALHFAADYSNRIDRTTDKLERSPLHLARAIPTVSLARVLQESPPCCNLFVVVALPCACWEF